MTEISVKMPDDHDGYIRRACPHCERELKWFHGQTPERPADFADPDGYYCPYCGIHAGPDSWWTEGQLAYAHDVAQAAALRMAQGAMERGFRGTPGITFKRGKRPDEPLPLVEPNDMEAVAPPCHAFEPFKILEGWPEPLHCIVCGERFTL